MSATVRPSPTPPPAPITVMPTPATIQPPQDAVVSELEGEPLQEITEEIALPEPSAEPEPTPTEAEEEPVVAEPVAKKKSLASVVITMIILFAIAGGGAFWFLQRRNRVNEAVDDFDLDNMEYDESDFYDNNGIESIEDKPAKGLRPEARLAFSHIKNDVETEGNEENTEDNL